MSYNRDDCESLADLRDLLWSLAGEVAEARSATEDTQTRSLSRSLPCLIYAERLVAASKVATGGRWYGQHLVAMDFSASLMLISSGRFLSGP